jgi:ribonuclease T1
MRSQMTIARRFRHRIVSLGMVLLALLSGVPTAAQGFDEGSAGGVATIRAVELPPQARETLHLIKIGGPFLYPRDGAVFGNYERLLPRKPRGYYHEYTVPTPGAHDRGARRIISGQAGELYYTDNHYRTFKRIIE